MNRTHPNAGFTLLELLAAAGITVVLAAIVLSVTSGTLRAWHRTQEASTCDTAARLVLDYLERDLQAAIFRADGHAWLAEDIINDSGALGVHGWMLAERMKPPVSTGHAAGNASIASARFGVSGAWLRLFTTSLDPDGSLPIAVAYQIARRPVSGAVSVANPAAIRYGLFRSAVTPENTFAAGFDLRTSYASVSATPSRSRSAATLTNSNTADLIASNVVDFGAWLYTRDAAGALKRIFPRSDSDTTYVAATREDFPQVVDVMVRILTEEGAQAIESLESANGAATRPAAYASDAEWWWATARAHSRVYVRRFEVLATAP